MNAAILIIWILAVVVGVCFIFLSKTIDDVSGESFLFVFGLIILGCCLVWTIVSIYYAAPMVLKWFNS